MSIATNFERGIDVEGRKVCGWGGWGFFLIIVMGVVDVVDDDDVVVVVV